MATNKIVENDEREENKKGIIIFIIILILLLALFIGIRAFSDKKEDKKEKKEPKIEEVQKEDVVEGEEQNDYSYVATTKKTSKVKKTSNRNEETKETLSLVLKGSNVIYVDYADNYLDEGAYALDTKDGDLSVSIVKTIYLNGTVVDRIDTTNSNATYTIKYVVTNSRGESKEIIRTVIIKEADVTIALNGNSEETMEYHVSNPTTYNDLGATATTSDGKNIPVTTTTTLNDAAYTGNVSSQTKGTYKITYTASYNGKEYQTERTVVVADTTAPVVTTEKDEYKYLVAETATSEITLTDIENLFTISDEDANITKTLMDANNVEMTTNISKTIEGEYTITLTATDSSNNTTSKAIVIKVMNDTEAPVVTVTDVSTNPSEYQFEITATDNYSTLENITFSYAVIDNVGGEIFTFNDLQSNTFSLTKAVETSTTAVTKYVIVKATDENGNESVSDLIEVVVNHN